MKQLIFSLAILFFANASAGEFEDAIDAYERKDYRTAITKFRSAADKGNVLAQFNMGLMFRNGYGTAQDYKEAARWFKLAGQQGHPQAQYNLALMHEMGQGVSQSYAESIRLYRLAAIQGLAQAQNNLATLYGNGQGVEKDVLMSYMWYTISAQNGNAISLQGLNALATQMSNQQIEKSKRLARECIESKYQKCN